MNFRVVWKTGFTPGSFVRIVPTSCHATKNAPLAHARPGPGGPNSVVGCSRIFPGVYYPVKAMGDRR